MAYYDYLDGLPESAQISNLKESLALVKSLTAERRTSPDEFAISVMLHAHCIAALERFLSSKFITATLDSPEFMKTHVESEPEYKNKTIKLRDIYRAKEDLPKTVGEYLEKVLYHRVDVVRKMYRRTFNIEFGNVSWLEKAVRIRHGCVHRAGHNKDGTHVDVSFTSVDELCRQCLILAGLIEDKLNEVISNT